MAYLCLERRSACHRERVIEALWPDVDPARSRRRLNTAVWRLRSVLDCAGSPVVKCATSGHLELSADVDVDVCDVIERVEAADGIDGWPELAALDDADFVSGCYHQWVVEARLRLAHAVNRTLERRLDRCRRSGDLEEALSCAGELARREPYREDAHRIVIRLAVQLGKYDQAEQQYARCIEVLRDELAVEPTAETVLAIAEGRRQRACDRAATLPDENVLRSLDAALRNCRDAIEAIELATRQLSQRCT